MDTKRRLILSKHTHTDTTTILWPFSGTTRVSRCQKKTSSGLTVKGKITEADTPTFRLGATPCGLCDPPPSSPIFMLDALYAATLPVYPDLGQAPNMLACIPSGFIEVK